MVTAIDSATSNTAALPATHPGARRTLQLLQSMGRKLDASDPAVVQQTASQLVSELAFKPLLAEMRKFPLGRELTCGGAMDGTFAEQLDQRIADAVAQADRGVLTQIITKLQDNSTSTAATVPAGSAQAWWPWQLRPANTGGGAA